MSKLTHLDDKGEVHMVNVGEKATTHRVAIARGRVIAAPDTIRLIASGQAAKGDVLATARIAAIMAAKKTPELIPLCHAVALSHVEVELTPNVAEGFVQIRVEAHAVDRTGIEMEALTAVSVAALTIYDMLKAVDRGMIIGPIALAEKRGGKSGTWRAPIRVVRKTPPQQALPEPETTPPEAPKPHLQRARRPMPADRPPTIDPPAASPEASVRASEVIRLAGNDPRLEQRLSLSPIGSAYMLGDLDDPYAEHCEWHGLLNETGELGAVLLHYQGLSMPAVLASGGPVDVEAIFKATSDELPRRFYAHIRKEHRRSLEVLHDFHKPREMCRMGLTRAEYKPRGDSSGVTRLTHRDTGAVMRLYAHYPDNFFEPAQLSTGLYCGIRIDGQLVAVAGLHVLSERYNVAAIGNIVTHADYRRKGLATHCVRHLLDDLFDRVGHVALNVQIDNTSAIGCYENFGFTPRFNFLEGWATRR